MLTNCYVCQSKNTRFLFRKNTYDIYFCNNCEIGFVKQIEDVNITNLYQEDYFTGNVEKFGYLNYESERYNRELSFRNKVKMITKIFPNGGKILDVGCADGTFLTMLPLEWNKFGVEINSQITKYIKTSCNIFIGDFINYNEEKDFDIITMWDFIDHTTQPLKYLQKAYNLLKQNGLLMLNVGDMGSLFAKIMGRKWYIFIPPTHLYFFTKNGIIKILKKAKFETKIIIREGKYVSLNLCFFRMRYIFSQKIFGWLIKNLGNTIIGKATIYYNFFDTMTIVAQKK